MKRLDVKKGRSEYYYYGIRLYNIFSKINVHNKLREINISVHNWYQKGYAEVTLVDNSKKEFIQRKTLFHTVFKKQSHKEIYMLFLTYKDRGLSDEEAYRMMIYDTFKQGFEKARKDCLLLIDEFEKDIENILTK